MTEAPPGKMSAWQQVRAMQWNFWVANLIEAGERLAFFGVRAILPIYMCGDDSVLHLTQTQKGNIFGIWALIQCLVPMVSGGYTEAFGYRLSMIAAFTLNLCGYLAMATADGFWTMLLAACLVGLGTAIFKPAVHGTIARSLRAENSGLGFGVFYWVVNVGGFLAPMCAALLRGDKAAPTWSQVFYGAAIVTALNYLPAIFLYQEPPAKAAEERKDPLKVFAETFRILFRDGRMLRFLLMISAFWLMFMQLWDTMPNFIAEWVDTSDCARLLAGVLGENGAARFLQEGQVKPEMMINLDAFTIILFCLPLSWAFGRLPMLLTLVLGMILALLGFLGTGLTQIGLVAALMIVVFAVGEILCSPKFSEYVGMTAPPDKKALYMGYSNIPFAVGWAAGNWLMGPLYDEFASRANLARRYLVDRLGMPTLEAEGLQDQEVFSTLTARLGATPPEAARTLWDAYHPWVIWVILGGIAFLATIAMVVTYLRSRRPAASEPLE